MVRLSEAMRAVDRKLSAGAVVILDGATGTELQRRGVPMDDAAWCALATASHPDVLRAIHEDYVDAGADVLTANNFATLRHMLERAGHGGRTAELQRQSVLIAREAALRAGDRVGRQVAVAGSLSTMRPVGKGTDARDPSVDPATLPWAASLREAAERQAEAGVDLLLLEMISDLDHGGLALEAARATGLPVWVGLSARRRGDELMGYRDDSPPFATLVEHYAREPLGALGIMHTALPEIAAALDLLLARAPMPIMAYPESGYFQAPDWAFVEVAPDDFAAAAAGWVERGARLVGGCCGLGPEHIAALTHTVGGPTAR